MSSMGEGLQRLGKNLNGYLGERIGIAGVVSDCVAAARAHRWSVQEISTAPNLKLFALTRHASRITSHALRIYISAGIHGDEPAGPLAIRQLLQEDHWPAEVSLWVCACLNPMGFA